MQSHLTEMFDGGFSQQLRKTPPGMAHLAGTGPSGETCRTCRFFEAGKYYATGGKHRGQLRPAPCAKYRQLSNGVKGAAVPHSARACKHFEKSANPKPAVAS